FSSNFPKKHTLLFYVGQRFCILKFFGQVNGLPHIKGTPTILMGDF
ncbi:hypothetical protein BSG1_20670, partial [Bacillus sp. SG-1]